MAHISFANFRLIDPAQSRAASYRKRSSFVLSVRFAPFTLPSDLQWPDDDSNQGENSDRGQDSELEESRPNKRPRMASSVRSADPMVIDLTEDSPSLDAPALPSAPNNTPQLRLPPAMSPHTNPWEYPQQQGFSLPPVIGTAASRLPIGSILPAVVPASAPSTQIAAQPGPNCRAAPIDLTGDSNDDSKIQPPPPPSPSWSYNRDSGFVLNEARPAVPAHGAGLGQGPPVSFSFAAPTPLRKHNLGAILNDVPAGLRSRGNNTRQEAQAISTPAAPSSHKHSLDFIMNEAPATHRATPEADHYATTPQQMSSSQQHVQQYAASNEAGSPVSDSAHLHQYPPVGCTLPVPRSRLPQRPLSPRMRPTVTYAEWNRPGCPRAVFGPPRDDFLQTRCSSAHLRQTQPHESAQIRPRAPSAVWMRGAIPRADHHPAHNESTPLEPRPICPVQSVTTDQASGTESLPPAQPFQASQSLAFAETTPSRKGKEIETTSRWPGGTQSSQSVAKDGSQQKRVATSTVPLVQAPQPAPTLANAVTQSAQTTNNIEQASRIAKPTPIVPTIAEQLARTTDNTQEPATVLELPNIIPTIARQPGRAPTPFADSRPTSLSRGSTVDQDGQNSYLSSISGRPRGQYTRLLTEASRWQHGLAGLSHADLEKTMNQAGLRRAVGSHPSSTRTVRTACDMAAATTRATDTRTIADAQRHSGGIFSASPIVKRKAKKRGAASCKEDRPELIPDDESCTSDDDDIPAKLPSTLPSCGQQPGVNGGSTAGRGAFRGDARPSGGQDRGVQNRQTVKKSDHLKIHGLANKAADESQSSSKSKTPGDREMSPHLTLSKSLEPGRRRSILDKADVFRFEHPTRAGTVTSLVENPSIRQTNRDGISKSEAYNQETQKQRRYSKLKKRKQAEVMAKVHALAERQKDRWRLESNQKAKENKKDRDLGRAASVARDGPLRKSTEKGCFGFDSVDDRDEDEEYMASAPSSSAGITRGISGYLNSTKRVLVEPEAAQKPQSCERGFKRPRIQETSKPTKMVTLLISPYLSFRLKSWFEEPKDPAKPVGNKCYLVGAVPRTGNQGALAVPREVRECIYRFLLQEERPIGLYQGWTLVQRRQKVSLHPAIMASCRQIHDEATEVLYGQNSFHYTLRDDAIMVKSHETQPGEVPFPLRQKSGYLRHLRLDVQEHAGTKAAYIEAMVRAFFNLNYMGINQLFMLTIWVMVPHLDDDEVLAAEYFQNTGIIDALKSLRSMYIRVNVYLPEDESDGARGLYTIIDKRTEWGRLEILSRKNRQNKNLSHEERERLAEQQLIRESEEKTEAQLKRLSDGISEACTGGAAEVVDKGWFKKFTPEFQLLQGFRDMDSVDDADDDSDYEE